MSTMTHFPNASIGSLYDRTKELVVAGNNQDVLTCVEYSNLVAAGDAFNVSFNQINKSFLTPEIKEAKELMERYFMSLYEQVKSDLKSPEPDKRTAATNLMFVLRSEGAPSTVKKLRLSDKSKVMLKIIAGLSTPPMQLHIATLNTGNKYTALVNGHNHFESIFAQRSSENAVAKAIASATKQRVALEDAFQAFIDFVDAKVTTKSGRIWDELSANIHERIDELAHSYRPKPRTKKSDYK